MIQFSIYPIYLFQKLVQDKQISVEFDSTYADNHQEYPIVVPKLVLDPLERKRHFIQLERISQFLPKFL